MTPLGLNKTISCPTFSLPQRLYRQDYHKTKDKIHTTYDTPDIKQVKMNQDHLSDVWRHLQTIYLIDVPIFIHVD